MSVHATSRWVTGFVGTMLAALTLSLGSPAWAVYQCGDQKDDCQCGANNPFPCCDNGGNCTWWAWEAACCHWKVDVPMRHNAKTWVADAKASPDYKVLDHPVVNSIACRDVGTYGHVAWVIAVNGSKITVTEENCCTGCNYGMRQKTYDASYFTGGFIVRANTTCDCKAGDTDTRSCDKCGHQTRTCSDGCNWDSWGACEGQGDCEKNAKVEEACGTCGSHERTCAQDCTWGPWTDCEGPDPEGGSQSCATGQQGVCAAGVNRCVDGEIQCVASKSASEEVCNGEDDDCDGLTDEDDVCGGDLPPAKDASTDSSSRPDVIWGAGGGSDGDTDGGSSSGKGFTGVDDEKPDGCACRVSGAAGGGHRAPWELLLVLGGAVAWTRRQRRR